MMSSSNTPCAACKTQRRKCTRECVFAPYFPPEQIQKFMNVHKVFGASNVSKLLNELRAEHREDAVNSLAYEADARLRDPVYGCVGLISILQQKLKEVQAALYIAKRELSTYIGPQAMRPMFPTPPAQYASSGSPSFFPYNAAYPEMGRQKGSQLVIREPQPQPQPQAQVQPQYLDAQQLAAVKERQQQQQEFVMRLAVEQKMLQQQQLLQLQQQQQQQQQQQIMMNQYHLQPGAQDLMRFDQGVEGSVGSSNGYNQYFGNGTSTGSGLALGSGYDDNNNSGLALGSGYDNNDNTYHHQHQPQQPEHHHQQQFQDEEQLSLQTAGQQPFLQLATQPQLYKFDEDEQRPGFGLSG